MKKLLIICLFLTFSAFAKEPHVIHYDNIDIKIF